MEDQNNVICIYDDTKDELSKIIIKIYEKFLENEMENLV